MPDRDAGRGTRDAPNIKLQTGAQQPGLVERRRSGIDPRQLDEIGIGASIGFVLWTLTNLLGVYSVIEVKDWVTFPSCLLLCVLLWHYRWRRTLWTIVAVPAFAVIVIAGTPIIRGPVHRWIRRDPLPRHVDAVVVPHGGSTADSLLGSGTLDRMIGAVDLLRSGISSTLIVTEPHEDVSSEPDQMHVAKYASGIRTFAVRDVRTTRDEAEKVAHLARPLGIRDIAVVTSPIHSRRACAAFERVGFRVACVPAADRYVAVQALDNPYDRIHAFQQWLHERVGLIWYQLRGHA